MVQFKKTQLILLAPVIPAVIAILFLAFGSDSPTIRVGMAEATEIDISVKIPGRLDSLFVREGDSVSAGSVLATLKSPELEARTAAARHAWEAARFKAEIAKKGARTEEVRAAESVCQQAFHQFELAEKTWKRVQAVFADGVLSVQEHDQAEFQFQAAKSQMEAAKARLEMIRTGLRPEEVQAAEALAAAAENQYLEVISYLGETRIKAPASGEITRIVADPGEMVAAGYPVITLTDRKNQWVVVNIRETELAGVKSGDLISGTIPGLNNQTATFKISLIAPAADYATWRATQEKADFDLKTFEIRLVPDPAIPGMRPGMTVRLDWPE